MSPKDIDKIMKSPVSKIKGQHNRITNEAIRELPDGDKTLSALFKKVDKTDEL